MNNRCPVCSRTNPVDAAYCYHDGAALSAQSGGGPAAMGSAPFPTPFYFADGNRCANFNQLLVACDNRWDEAKEYLSRGFWSTFFAGMGRIDLARAAESAAAEPDTDRGLSWLVERFPADADTFKPPRLELESTSFNLGQLAPGQDHRLELVIINQGMLLLHGDVSSNCDWLVFGDASGDTRKYIQTTKVCTIPVRALGSKLRASAKPVQAKIVVVTNGGAITVPVRADIPVRPFPSGLGGNDVLAGATTPRDIALKARKYPVEAAELFEVGAVKDWYAVNGWDYPVDGAAGTGKGAVQQFFEALGLTKPPKIEINTDFIRLKARPGERITRNVSLSTKEAKPVYAQGVCSQDWVRFGKGIYKGNKVKIPVEIEVPQRAGETIETQITFRGNGRQQFVVPLTLTIEQAAMPHSDPALAAGGVVLEMVPIPDGATPAPSRRSEKGEDAAFGTTRIVYWTAMIGAWSALVGWGVSEILLGRWVNTNVFVAVLMVAFVGTALGAGLSQVSGLTAFQGMRQLISLGPGLLGGLIGGLIGGCLGNLLFYLVGDRLTLLAFIGRVLGWTLLGVAIGVSEGVIALDWRKVKRGLIGGSLGGFIGGLLFNPVTHVIGSPASSRAFAFVIIGLCIGLFISLVEELMKEAWITVEAGFRAGRELVLKQDVTTMGTSEKSSLIFIAYGAKGVEPLHLQISRDEDGTFYLEDLQSRTGTLLNGERVMQREQLHDGDLIEFGVNKVRFHMREVPREEEDDEDEDDGEE